MLKFVSVGVAAMVLAAPATAQTRGTVEFGGFGSRTSFGSSLNMNPGWGLGGRIGAFITPSLSIEMEGGSSNSTRPSGLQDVRSSVLTARLAATPITLGRLKLVIGGGIDHTDTYFIESYGAHGLLGAKFRITDGFALRLDGILGKMSNGKAVNTGIHLGFATFRSPRRLETVNTIYRDRDVVGPSIAQRPDSVSAYETNRLRVIAANYSNLRDSLNRQSYSPASSASALATMQEMIHFPREGYALSDSAKAILRDKVTVFKANPDMRIIITGYASSPGTAEYNMALGLKRATAAKEYLVSMGVAENRVEISTKGEGRLLVEGPGELANAENRRGQFRLLIADPFLAAPVIKQ
jgi:outer membrane protein OmpA-like peptidoglycan-associated protein